MEEPKRSGTALTTMRMNHETCACIWDEWELEPNAVCDKRKTVKGR